MNLCLTTTIHVLVEQRLPCVQFLFSVERQRVNTDETLWSQHRTFSVPDSTYDVGDGRSLNTVDIRIEQRDALPIRILGDVIVRTIHSEDFAFVV